LLLNIKLQDRPDLIQSELAGLAFDSLQQVFRKGDIEIMYSSSALPLVQDTMIWMVIDPAAGGPQSDYAIVTIARIKGCVVVRALIHTTMCIVVITDQSILAIHEIIYVSKQVDTKLFVVILSSIENSEIILNLRLIKNVDNFSMLSLSQLQMYIFKSSSMFRSTKKQHRSTVCGAESIKFWMIHSDSQLTS
jgi:hypothetical protein